MINFLPHAVKTCYFVRDGYTNDVGFKIIISKVGEEETTGPDSCLDSWGAIIIEPDADMLRVLLV